MRRVIPILRNIVLRGRRVVAAVLPGLAALPALAGDMVVIGSPGDTVVGLNNVGSIRIYRRVGNAWTFQQRIDPPAPAGGADQSVGGFGAAIAIDGDRLVVGAPKRHLYGFGRVFEFARIGNTWTHLATVPPDGGNV